MICTYVVNDRMTSLFSDVATTVNENIADFTRFGNNTVNVSHLPHSVVPQLV